jgi:hypothetical protein
LVAPIITVPSAVWRRPRQEGGEPLGDEHLAALGVNRHIEADLPAELRRAEPGGNDDAWRRQRFALQDETEIRARRLDALDA